MGARVDLDCHCGRRRPVSVQTEDDSACPPGPVFQSTHVTVSEWSDWFYFLAISRGLITYTVYILESSDLRKIKCDHVYVV